MKYNADPPASVSGRILILPANGGKRYETAKNEKDHLHMISIKLKVYFIFLNLKSHFFAPRAIVPFLISSSPASPEVTLSTSQSMDAYF